MWTREQIRDLREYIESYGMRWSVVESLPVTETIKYGGPDRDEQIAVYKESLANLGKEGIRCVCYNFMPVLDWARTDLLHPNPNGSSNLYFDWGEFAYFDIHILKREGAEEEWTKISRGEAKGHLADILRGRDIMAEVNAIKAKATPEFDHDMVDTIVIKTQGFVSGNFKEGDERPVACILMTRHTRFWVYHVSSPTRRISVGSSTPCLTRTTVSRSAPAHSQQAGITT